MKSYSVSIQNQAGYYSVDIRPLDGGTASPCGACKRFKWLGDALIFVSETVGKSIPADWPSDFSTLNETI